VHRDVKPANVLLEGERAFLTDFGVTRDAGLGSDLTRTGEALGTVDYMAPEQAAGAPVDGRADVYALACVLFRSLTGGVVFDRPSALDRMWAHRHDPPPDLRALRPDLPEGLAGALRQGLAKDPQDRPATAGALAAAALAGLAG
jgi:serine/threonine-protein kinase